ncbi:MAG: hypothetical protein ACTSQ4_04720 [Candidatus Heimdallarchaeaceae archaeon]
MKCPYCGYLRPERKKESLKAYTKMYTCPRCDYLFNVPTGEVILDKILSIPFSSIIYTPLILTINYFVAHFTYGGGIFDFGVFLAFYVLMSMFTILFILYVTTRGSVQIFIVKKSSSEKLFQRIKDISPLIKITVLLGIAMIIIPFVLHQRLF